MIRAEAWRASWLLHAETVGDSHSATEGKLCLLGTVLERIREGFLAESRLTGVELQVVVPDWNAAAVVNEDRLITGLSGAVMATLGLVEESDRAEVALIISSPGGTLGIDVAQETTAVTSETAGRFFDPAWTDRPGGWLALTGALVAKAVAQQHGGDAVFVVRAHRGSTLRVTLDQGR
jgi:hypothetical protein